MMYIYLVENKINGKKYIGQSRQKNDSYLGSGVYIKNAVKKYGKENFKKIILEDDIKNDELLNEREIYWINKLNAIESNEFYNIAEGGYRKLIGNIKKGHSKERKELWKKRLSESHKGDKVNRYSLANHVKNYGSWNKGKTYTYEDIMGVEKSKHVKKQISVRLKNKHKSKDHNRKNSEGQKKAWEKRREAEIMKCIYCGKQTIKSNIVRWHNDNCKFKVKS